MKVKVLSGSFENGCGVIVHYMDNFYHLVVFEDKETGKLFVEINNKRHYEEDIERIACND